MGDAGRYRKKPVVIDAIQFDGSFPLDFLGDDDKVRSAGDGSGAIEIVTLEGAMRAERGDWIIRGVKGELYPCKSDIFAATYEPAPPEGQTPSASPGEGAPVAFEYLLNRMENAASHETPADHGYYEARLAVFEYVARLRAERDEARREVKRLREEVRTTLLAEEERRKLTGDALAAEAEAARWAARCIAVLHDDLSAADRYDWEREAAALAADGAGKRGGE